MDTNSLLSLIQLKSWVEEEKKKTEKWCEDIKESAKKEKRAAAQYVFNISRTLFFYFFI